MTVGGWILFAILAIIIFDVCMIVPSICEKGYLAAAIIGFVLIAILCGGMHWYYGNTQSGKRAFKSQESNFGDGIERTVKVYDVNGGLITEYSGKFDITYDNDRILFDDENGKRHIIYYPTGTVIVDER